MPDNVNELPLRPKNASSQRIAQVFLDNPDILTDLKFINLSECVFKLSYDPINLKNIIRFLCYYYNTNITDLYKEINLINKDTGKIISKQTFYSWLSENLDCISPSEAHWEQIIDFSKPLFEKKGFKVQDFCTRIGCSNYNLEIIFKASGLSAEQMQTLQGWNTPHRLIRYLLDKDSYRYRAIPYKSWVEFFETVMKAMAQKKEILASRTTE